MFKRSHLIGSIMFGSFVFAAGPFVQAGNIQGNVKGPDGKPIAGAEVQVARINSKQVLQRTTTDSKGHYVLTNLTAGPAFRVIAWVNKVPNAIDNVKARDEGAVRVDFDIKSGAAKTAGAKKKAKHYVWMPPPTGSNLGGRWVEVNDDAQPGKSDNLDQVSGEGLRRSMLNRPTGGVPH